MYTDRYMKVRNSEISILIDTKLLSWSNRIESDLFYIQLMHNLLIFCH